MLKCPGFTRALAVVGLGCLVIWPRALRADSVPVNFLPLATIFPTPTGIIFPAVSIAAGVNPAALPQLKRIAALEFSYAPPPSSGERHDYFTSFSSSNPHYGIGAGYLGSYQGELSQGYFFGGGVRAETLSVGLSLRNTNIATGSPEGDLGIIADYGKDFAAGIVFYGLQASPQIALGFGVGRGKNYQFEANILLPQLSTLFTPESDFTLVAASMVNLGFFSLSFKSSYRYATSEVNQSVSALFWFFKTVATVIQYSSPNRSYYGLIFTF